MNIPLSETIQTERCRLRAVSKKDIPHAWSATRYKGFNEGMTWEPPENIEELEGPLEKSIEAWKNGTDYSFTIADKNNGDFLGRISIRKEKGGNVWSIGFWIHPEHQKKGYAKECALAIVEFGFDRLGAKIIESACATWNIDSKKVLEGIGMKFVKENPHGFKKNGKWVAEFEYEIFKNVLHSFEKRDS